MPTEGTTPPSPAPSSVAERSTARTAIGDTAYTTPSTTVSALTSGATPTRLPTRPSRSTRNGGVPLEEHPRPPAAVDHRRRATRRPVGHHDLRGTQVTGATDRPHGDHAADGDHAGRGEDAGSRAGAHHLGVVAAVGEEHGTVAPGEQRALPVGTGERQPGGERRCGGGAVRGLRFHESGDAVDEYDARSAGRRSADTEPRPAVELVGGDLRRRLDRRHQHRQTGDDHGDHHGDGGEPLAREPPTQTAREGHVTDPRSPSRCGVAR